MITTLWWVLRSPNIVLHAIHLLADLSRRLPFAARWRSAWCQESPEITTCDCTLCRQNNALMTKVRASALAVESGEDLLSVNEWNTHSAKHVFCSRRGIYTFQCKHGARLFRRQRVLSRGIGLGATVAEDGRTNKNAASVSGSGVLYSNIERG